MSGSNTNFTQGTVLSVYQDYSGTVAVGTSNFTGSNYGQGTFIAGKSITLAANQNSSNAIGTTLVSSSNTSNYTLTYPAVTSSNGTLPGAQNIAIWDQNGVGSFTNPTFNTLWNGSNMVTNAIGYTNQATSTSGIVTFTLTKNGLPTGPAIFSSIMAVIALGFSTGNLISQMVLVGGYQISADLKTVKISLASSGILSLGGSALTFPPDGARCHVLVIGN